MDVQAMLNVACLLSASWMLGGAGVLACLLESSATRGAIVAAASATVLAAISFTVCAILAAGWPS